MQELKFIDYKKPIEAYIKANSKIDLSRITYMTSPVDMYLPDLTNLTILEGRDSIRFDDPQDGRYLIEAHTTLLNNTKIWIEPIQDAIHDKEKLTKILIHELLVPAIEEVYKTYTNEIIYFYQLGRYGVPACDPATYEPYLQAKIRFGIHSNRITRK